MKVLFLFGLLIASSAALNCETPNAFEAFLCGVKTAVSNVGHQALDSLKQTAIQGATDLGSTLINGLQNIAHVAETPSKRDVDIGEVMKVVEFVSAHKDFVEELGGIMVNVTKATSSKVQGLLKEYKNNPSVEILTGIVNYLKSHHVLQSLLLKWVDNNAHGLTAFAMKEFILTHTKRDVMGLLGQVAGVAGQLKDAFQPFEEKLVGAVNNLGHQVMGFASGLMANQGVQQMQQVVSQIAPQLTSLAQPVESIIQNAQGALGPIKAAAGNILGEVMKTVSTDGAQILGQITSSLKNL